MHTRLVVVFLARVHCIFLNEELLTLCLKIENAENAGKGIDNADTTVNQYRATKGM